MYESEFTVWMRELKAQRPHLEQQQRDGRAIWWDHPQTLDQQRRDEASQLAQPAYPYFPLGK